jgi:hypothetical protein
MGRKPVREPPPFRVTAAPYGEKKDLLAQGHQIVHRLTGEPVTPGQPINQGDQSHTLQGLYSDNWNVPTVESSDPQGNPSELQHTNFPDYQILKPGEQWKHPWYTDFDPLADHHQLLNHSGQEISPGDEVPTSRPGYKYVYRGITRVPGSHSPGAIAVDSFNNGKYVDTNKDYSPIGQGHIISRQGTPRFLDYDDSVGMWRNRDETDPFSALEYMHQLSANKRDSETTGEMGDLQDGVIDQFGQWFDALPSDQRREYMEHPISEAAFNDWQGTHGRAHHTWQGSGVGGRGQGGYGTDDRLMDYYINKKTKDWNPDSDAFDPREFGV